MMMMIISRTALARGCWTFCAVFVLLTRTTCWSFQPAKQHRQGIIETRGILLSRPLSPIFQLYSSTPFQQDSTTTSTTTSIDKPSSSWKPSISSLSERKSYLRTQSQYSSEHLGTLGFHHVELYTGDAFMTAKRFELALGIPITCWSSLATGNDVCVTYGLECDSSSGSGGETEREPGEGVRLMITAPLSRALQKTNNKTSNLNINLAANTAGSNVDMTAPLPLPGYDVHAAHEFYSKHGLAVRAVGVEVQDARMAYESAVRNGAVSVLEPTSIPNYNNGEKEIVYDCRIAEVSLYGDVVLRFISFDGSAVTFDLNSSRPSPFLPNLSPYPSCKSSKPTYGLTRIDHTVGNVPNLLIVQNYIQKFTGYHPFAEFTPEDIGTVESGLNSVVLASDNEAVLLPLNEPTLGKRKSQIQTYLEQNEGPGLQHIAIKTNDIFHTIRKMRYAEEHLGGFELMVRPSSQYYEELPSRLGDKLSLDQYEQLEKLGILADADDEGVLLQIFTKPLGDRPTLFLEIIQRIGCVLEEKNDGQNVEGKGISSSSINNNKNSNTRRKIKERPGCGGFGQGNFRELFKAIEDHEKTLNV